MLALSPGEKQHSAMLTFLRRACFLIVALSPVIATAQSSSSDLRREVANLTQDVRALQGLLGTLRIEIEDLQRQNAQLRASLTNVKASQSGDSTILRQVDARLAAMKAELLNEDAETRKEIIASVKKQMDSLASQVQESLRKIAGASSGRATTTPPKPFTEEYPKNGIMYLVKSGDTLSGIASQHNSRVTWIRSANKIVDASRDLHAGDTIFVPQE